MRFFKKASMLLGVAFSLAAASVAQAAVVTQLGFLIDTSGSIGSSNFNIMKAGYASAFAALPTDGTVEITVVQFNTNASVVISPTVISSQAVLNSVIATINGMAYQQGYTAMSKGLDLISDTMVASANYSSGIASMINMSTDGQPNCPQQACGYIENTTTTAAAAAATKAAGIDALTVEAIGAGVSLSFLQDIVFSPLGNGTDVGVILPSGAVGPNPMSSNPWVLPVNSYDDFGAAILNKVQAIVNPTPAPGALMLVALGLCGLGVSRRVQSA